MKFFLPTPVWPTGLGLPQLILLQLISKPLLYSVNHAMRLGAGGDLHVADYRDYMKE